MGNECCKEEKAGCCEGKENCVHKTGCCHGLKKCCLVKIVVVLIVIIVIFCLGSQWGEMRAERLGGDRFERGRMMDWGYEKFNKDKTTNPGEVSSSIKVDVINPETTGQ